MKCVYLSSQTSYKRVSNGYAIKFSSLRVESVGEVGTNFGQIVFFALHFIILFIMGALVQGRYTGRWCLSSTYNS